jgi:hypothetical protein
MCLDFTNSLAFGKRTSPRFKPVGQTVISDLVRITRGKILTIKSKRAPVDEILLSHDKTIAVIDGSGVLADPVGINREELVRLAKARKPVSHFDKSKLSKDGYLVKVEDQDVKLPCEFGCTLPTRSPRLRLPFQPERPFWMGPTSGTRLTSGSRLTYSFLAEDGTRILTSSRLLFTISLRIALRQSTSLMSPLWSMPRASLTTATSPREQTCSSRSKPGYTSNNARSSCSKTRVPTRVVSPALL